MTPTPRDHRLKGRPRRLIWNAVVFGVVLCILGVGNLYRVQGNYQDCVADYLAYDSKARDARSEASGDTTQALVDAFLAAQRVARNDGRQPSQVEINDFIAKIAAVPRTAETYDTKVAKYPYRDFKKVCG